jgi:DNA-binding transcriptional regulator YdaS (Cro superfamily)
MLSKYGMTEPTPLERAIAIAGSEAKLGALIGKSQVAINKAKHRSKVSAGMAVAIDRALGGRVTRHELCPDIFDAPEQAIAS